MRIAREFTQQKNNISQTQSLRRASRATDEPGARRARPRAAHCRAPRTAARRALPRA
jgi:hypothetical protein